MTITLGLTGSIGMGKSTTAAMFAERGCAVWDADAAVARLYDHGGAAVAPMADLIPSAVADGTVDRSRLRKALQDDPSLFEPLENLVHPLVRDDRRDFLAKATEDIVVFDIPLLFETGSDAEVMATACVSVSPDIQRTRVLERGTMTEEAFNAILARQMPNAEKCARATYVISTSTRPEAESCVEMIIDDLRRRFDHA